VDKENGYLGVSYPSLIPVIIEAVKEQESEISKLRAEKDGEIALLNERNGDLEARVAQLEDLVARQIHGKKRASALGMLTPMLAAVCLIGMVVMGRGRNQMGGKR